MAGRVSSPCLPALLFLLSVAFTLRQASADHVLNIGYLSDEKDDYNLDLEILQLALQNGTGRSEVRLVPVPRLLTEHNPVAVAKEVCSLLDGGVTAIIDATSPARGPVVASLCQQHGVPCLETRADRRLHSRHTDGGQTEGQHYTLSLHPARDVVAKAAHDVLHHLQWSYLALVYDTADHLALAEEVLADSYFKVVLLKMENKEELGQVMQRLQQAGGLATVVLALRPHRLQAFVSEATRTGLAAGRRTSYFVPDLDVPEPLLKSLAQHGSLVTALRLGNSESLSAALRSHGGQELLARATLQNAAVLDALRLLSAGLAALPAAPQQEGDLCLQQRIWTQGRDLMASIRNTTATGVTGRLELSGGGPRTEVSLSVQQLTDSGVNEVANWRWSDRVVMPSYVSAAAAASRQKRDLPKLRVSVLLSAPYVMLRIPGEEEEEEPEMEDDADPGETSSTENEFVMSEQNESSPNESEIVRPEIVLTGNERYEGFCVDLLEEIAAEVGFEFELELARDGKYGSYDEVKDEWTGAIGDVVHQRADVALGDITVKEYRSKVVSFTEPWHSSGIGLLAYRPPLYDQSNLCTFLEPFSDDLWLYLLLATVGVALLMFLLSRTSPCERNGPCEEKQPTWTPFTFCFSIWFTLATLFRQFVVQQPRAASTRLMALLWWFFVLVVVMFYIANLAAHLTLQRMESSANKVQSIYDLPNQMNANYNTFYGGTTWSFFKNSESETLQRIFSSMENYSKSRGPVTSNSEGVERVREGQGSYMHLMEEPSIEYIIERNCDLTKLGGTVGSASYAIVLQKGSPYLDDFNDALYRIKKSSRLESLKTKWWKHKRGGGRCWWADEYDTDGPQARVLTPADLFLPFLVLAVGAGVAVLIALLECCGRAITLTRMRESACCSELGSLIKEAVVGQSANTYGGDLE